MPKRRKSDSLIYRFGNCHIKSVRVFDQIQLASNGAFVKGRELDTIFWNEGPESGTSLVVAVEVEAPNLDSWATVHLSVTSGEDQYDVGGGRAFFKFEKMRALVLFEFSAIEFGPPAWFKGRKMNWMTFHAFSDFSVRGGVDRQIPITIDKPKRRRAGGQIAVLPPEMTPRKLLTKETRQIVCVYLPNPLFYYGRQLEIVPPSVEFGGGSLLSSLLGHSLFHVNASERVLAQGRL